MDSKWDSGLPHHSSSESTLSSHEFEQMASRHDSFSIISFPPPISQPIGAGLEEADTHILHHHDIKASHYADAIGTMTTVTSPTTSVSTELREQRRIDSIISEMHSFDTSPFPPSWRRPDLEEGTPHMVRYASYYSDKTLERSMRRRHSVAPNLAVHAESRDSFQLPSASHDSLQ
ncbi:hypothetical protein HDV03_004616 [Kappamyces sp. JEL0829]|nr:hypothetical protein HDV03_004616 [Kappamyces sp. JEL0829]